jgi:hypothetical protein
MKALSPFMKFAIGIVKKKVEKDYANGSGDHAYL